ncbi:MAG TPA: IPT/TIG domain-containing protein [Kofleriaceae bacterium]|jgi:hypothetical protein
MRNWLALGGIIFTAACGSSGTDIKCGDGTTLDNGECVSTGSGSNVTCGAGTQLDSTGTTCVPTPPGATGAPTITAMAPTEGGISGGDLFEIQGTGFAGDDVSAIHVYFGDTTPGTGTDLGPCEALIGAPTDTIITGQVPPDCTFSTSVTITVQTNLGMATTPFVYDALFAAEGDDYYNDLPAVFYAIDPEAGTSFPLANLVDADDNTYDLDGMAFSSSTLYAVSTGFSEADFDEASQLVTVDLSTYDPTMGTITVTPVADITDDGGNEDFVTDLKMSGTTLYGWGQFCSETCTEGLVTINTTTGVATPVGTMNDMTLPFLGLASLAVDSTGAVTAAPSGANPDTNDSATGEYDSINTTTGAVTLAATLDWGIGAPITTMVTIQTSTLGVVDNGTYSLVVWDENGQTGFPSFFGQTLAVIDPASTPIVGATSLALPSLAGAQPHISAMDMAPTTLAISRQIPTHQWAKLPAASDGPKPTAEAFAKAAANFKRARTTHRTPVAK